MKKYSIAAIAAIVGILTFGPPVEAAEKFQKLSGSQIQGRLAGMEITDEAHWADVFAANGTLTSYSMGRKNSGKWHVQNDEVCIDRANDDGGYYQVWLLGNKHDLPRPGSSLPLEGVLPDQRVRR